MAAGAGGVHSSPQIPTAPVLRGLDPSALKLGAAFTAIGSLKDSFTGAVSGLKTHLFGSDSTK